jgi:hypothetical protein
MATVLSSSEAMDLNWCEALAAPYRNPQPSCFMVAEQILAESVEQLHNEDAGSVERDAQEARLLRGMGLVAVYQGLSLRFEPEDVAQQLPVVEGHLERAHQKFAAAFNLTRPYLEGDRPMQPTRQAHAAQARSGIRREHGMTLAAKGAAQLAANVRRNDKTRDCIQPAIGAAYDELCQAGTRADRVSVAYLARRAETHAGRGTPAAVWLLRELPATPSVPTIEHRLFECIANKATNHYPC